MAEAFSWMEYMACPVFQEPTESLSTYDNAELDNFACLMLQVEHGCSIGSDCGVLVVAGTTGKMILSKSFELRDEHKVLEDFGGAYRGRGQNVSLSMCIPRTNVV